MAWPLARSPMSTCMADGIRRCYIATMLDNPYAPPKAAAAKKWAITSGVLLLATGIPGALLIGWYYAGAIGQPE